MGNAADLPKPTPDEISNRLKDLILNNSALPFPVLMEIESIMRDVDEAQTPRIPTEGLKIANQWGKNIRNQGPKPLESRPRD